MDKLTRDKITAPFTVDIKGEKYTGYLKVRPFYEPTHLDVFIGAEKIGDLRLGYNGNWRLTLSEEGKKIFNELKPYQYDLIAEELGSVVENNWNSSRWPQRVHPHTRDVYKCYK